MTGRIRVIERCAVRPEAFCLVYPGKTIKTMQVLCDKLLHVADHGILQYTLDEGKILYVNQGLLAIFDIADTPDSFKAKSVKNVLLDTGTYGRIRTQLLKKKEIHNFEYRFKTCRGKERWVHYDAFLMDGSTLKAKKVLALVKDVTEQKKIEKEYEQLKRVLQSEKKGLLKVAKEIEEELEKSEQKYRSLVEKAGAGVATLDVKGRFTYVNGALRKMIGYSKGELIGRPFAGFLHPDDKMRVMQIFSRASSNPGKKIELECRGIHKNGTEVQMHSIPAAYTYRGRILGFNAIITDITERKKAEEAVQRERDTAQQYLDIAGVIFVALNAKGTVTLINKKGCEVLGYNEKEIIGKSWFDNFVPKKQVDRVKSISKMLLEGNIEPAKYFENIVLTKTGEERLIAWHNTILRDENGNIIGHLSSGEDITRRRMIEDELRRSKELFEKSLASLDSAVFILDGKNPPIIIECNPAATAIFGYEKQEMIGRTAALLHSSRKTLVEFQKVMYPTIEKKGYLSSFEFQMKRKNGRIFPSEHSVFPLLDEKGDRSGYVSVVKDITERKKVQDALQKSQKRYYSLFEYSPSSLWEEDFSEVKKYIDTLKKRGIKDFRRYLEKHPEIVKECVALVKVLDTNKATLDQYCARNKENIITDLRNIFTEETYKSFIEDMVAIAQGKTFVKFQSPARTLTDDKVDRIMRWAVLPGYEDTYSKVLVSEIDITEQKRMLYELEKSHKLLRNLSAHLESVTEEERKSVSREIHDEFGQFLTALRMDISWLNKRINPEDLEVVKRVESMAHLTSEMIQSVKRISSHLRPSIIDDLGLAAAIEWQLDDFQKRTGIACSVHIEPEDIIIGTNISITVYRILQEALTNIARHTKASKVRVSLKKETDKLVLTVQDNGTGITEQKIRDSKSLGLLGMQERAHHIGGTVKINGKSGNGTMVRVSVPVS